MHVYQHACLNGVWHIKKEYAILLILPNRPANLLIQKAS